MNEISSIAGIYMEMKRSAPLQLIRETDVDVIEPEPGKDITQINVYIKPASGAIQRPYSGEVVNITYLDDNATVIANDTSNKKTIQAIIQSDGSITVSVMDADGRMQDTFMGQNLDFYDQDSEGKELNVIKIEQV